MMIDNPLCFRCKHFCHNFGDGTGIGYLAFPDGIVEEAGGGYYHHHVLPNQVGDYVFEEANYEDLPPFGKYLWDAREGKLNLQSDDDPHPRWKTALLRLRKFFGRY